MRGEEFGGQVKFHVNRLRTVPLRLPCRHAELVPLGLNLILVLYGGKRATGHCPYACDVRGDGPPIDLYTASHVEPRDGVWDTLLDRGHGCTGQPGEGGDLLFEGNRLRCKSRGASARS